MEIADKIDAVLTLQSSMKISQGRNPVITDWFAPILAEVAEIPRYRAAVHDIRRMVAQQTDSHVGQYRR